MLPCGTIHRSAASSRCLHWALRRVLRLPAEPKAPRKENDDKFCQRVWLRLISCLSCTATAAYFYVETLRANHGAFTSSPQTPPRFPNSNSPTATREFENAPVAGR